MAALRVYVIYVLPYRPYLVSLNAFSKATFLLPESLLRSLHPQLCGALLVVRVQHVAVGTSAWPFLQSTAPLSANLTVLELGTVCGNQLVMVWTSFYLVMILGATVHR
jgi:hypothetical protein